MDTFKIEYYEKQNPEMSFPPVSELSPDQCSALAFRIAEWVGCSDTDDRLALVRAVADRQEPIAEVRADSEGFDLRKVLDGYGIEPQTRVYINWYRFDRIDAMLIEDLCKWFEYIWYPGPDDIDIFDDSFTWIVSVSHEGTLSALRRTPER